jgi:hypothetical protein
LNGSASIVWDGIGNNGNIVPSGFYVCQINIDGKTLIGKILKVE